MLLFFGKCITKDIWRVEELTPSIYIRSYFVYGGDVTYKDEKNEVKLKKGHLYIFPTDKPYTISQNINDKLNHMHLRCILNYHAVKDIIEIDLENDNFLSGFEKSLSFFIDNDYPISLITSLVEVYMSYIKHKEYAIERQSTINKAIEFMLSNLMKKPDLDELSKVCGYSRDHFGKVFKAETGVSPHQYILGYKMTVAKYILGCGTSVSETAKRLGYDEMRTFSRNYKKAHGVSPSEVYIKNQSEEN